MSAPQKFRKRPVVVEAFQMTQARQIDNQDWPDWLNQAWNREPGENAIWIDPSDPTRLRLLCGTLEGVFRIAWGDWIVRGIEGELYPVKPDIFAASYEPVEEAP